MARDKMHRTAHPAPLPRHERAWRHPSEIGQHRRALSRRPALPLSPITASLCGALGVVLVVALVALIVPPTAKRETVRQVRNAAVSSPRPATTARPLPGLMTLDGRRFVLGLGATTGDARLFVTTGNPSGVVVDDEGRPTPLRVVSRADGLTLLTDAAATPATDKSAVQSVEQPASGTRVVVSGLQDVSAVIGIAVNTDVREFVPLAGDVLNTEVAESSVVTDLSQRVLGLYTERNGSHGYVPISVIDEALLRP